MILAANDRRHAHLDIVDDRRQHIQPRPVGAADDRVAERCRIDMALAAHKVDPRDRRGGIEPEPPVRGDPLGRKVRMIGVGQRERSAVVHRRQPLPRLHPPLEVELRRRLIRAVRPACCRQPRQRRVVQSKPVRLAHLGIRRQPEPVEVVADPRRRRVARPRRIGIVKAQQKPPPCRPRIQPVDQRGANVPRVETAGRGRGEAGNGHGRVVRTGTRRARAAAISALSFVASVASRRKASSR